MAFISVKYLLIGLILGLVVACGYVAVRYVMSSKLRTVGELESGFDFNVLGCVTAQNKSKLFRNSYDAYTNEEQVELIAANVKVLMERQGKQKLFLTGDSTTERCRDAVEQIAKSLNEKGLTCTTGASVAYDVDSIHKIAAADAVVLVEQIDVSRYDAIKKEKELCAECKIPVLGCVSVIG